MGVGSIAPTVNTDHCWQAVLTADPRVIKLSKWQPIFSQRTYLFRLPVRKFLKDNIFGRNTSKLHRYTNASVDTYHKLAVYETLLMSTLHDCDSESDGYPCRSFAYERFKSRLGTRRNHALPASLPLAAIGSDLITMVTWVPLSRWSCLLWFSGSVFNVRRIYQSERWAL